MRQHDLSIYAVVKTLQDFLVDIRTTNANGKWELKPIPKAAQLAIESMGLEILVVVQKLFTNFGELRLKSVILQTSLISFLHSRVFQAILEADGGYLDAIQTIYACFAAGEK